jgi:hypothetical protein
MGVVSVIMFTPATSSTEDLAHALLKRVSVICTGGSGDELNVNMLAYAHEAAERERAGKRTSKAASNDPTASFLAPTSQPMAKTQKADSYFSASSRPGCVPLFLSLRGGRVRIVR